MKEILTLRRNYENYGNYQFITHPRITTMKTSIFFAILATALYFYLRTSAPIPVQKVVSKPVERTTRSQTIVVAAVQPYHDRWSAGPTLASGPNAQTELKTGPNAQTDFEPFAPSEHAKWNQNQAPMYSNASGFRPRVR